ncbi:unnamed protein product [Schistosoma curassoni]|uniref:Reverse transcriptase domain-containing protein n=1 Tax=Schistosoma curassoni TaxID=6186 RepID=A0A3P8EG91_9TREM|nr:unnamed protein product [Schistosoma curassoni]
MPVVHYYYHQFLKNYFCGVIQRLEFTIHSPLEKFNEIGNDSPSQELDFKKNTIDSELHSLKISSKLLGYLTSNLQHLVDKWHQTCAQLEDILTVGLILLCPINPKKELQDSHHSHPYVFHFNLRYVLTHGRSYLTGVFSSWIVKNNITPEQVLSFYQRICAKSLPVEDESANNLITCDSAHIRQVIFSLAYKRLPFTLELDTILSTVCWIHFQCWLNKLEEQVPMDWKGHLIEILKKGDLSKCENYRGITPPSIPGKVLNRVLPSRMKDAVDTQLRDQQAGSRKDRSCTDRIATLWIIFKLSVEWNSTVYINFVDYEKSFDSVDRRTLWKLLRHYGVPEKIVNIIWNSYDRLQCKVMHRGQLADAFQVSTGVRQGCILSLFLFILLVDWIMKTCTSEGKHGIQWTTRNQLEDLEFSDDLALLSHTHEQMQIKTASVAAVSASVGLSIHKGKTKVLKYNTENNNPITLDGETLEDVESFTYLRSIIDEQGGSDVDVKMRIGKARAAFLQLENI